MNHGIVLATLVAGALAVPIYGVANFAAAVSPSGEPRWTANIKSVSQFRFNAADSTRDRSHGSAQWNRGDGPAFSSVSLAFTYAGTERGLSWAILFGSCGNSSLPVIPMSTFPELDVSGGGRAQITATISLEFPTSGAYHIEIYKDRTGGSESLVGCGNFKFVKG